MPPSIKKLDIAVIRCTVPEVRKIHMDEALRTNLGLVDYGNVGASEFMGSPWYSSIRQASTMVYIYHSC